MSTPVNFQKQNCSPQAIAKDVDYARQIADFYVYCVPSDVNIASARALELGPGYSLGTAIVLACCGARVTVADRYLPRWDSDYHEPFFRALRDRLRAEDRQYDLTPITKLIDASAFVPEAIACLDLGVEDLDHVEPNSFDVVFSNAVLEHVGNVRKAIKNLARLTCPGGVGLHQIDFRDHRDFSRPLEYFTMSDPDFKALFQSTCGECGNRWRPDAIRTEWERAGFNVLVFEDDMYASDEYINDLLPRIHPDCAYLDHEALRIIGGYFALRNAGY